ncbi:hypothetical protein ECP03047993_3355 [Escherichia coli P0304799.3]|nr:hypothetical protein ECP03047993_3355 [Escherichia coli P0304799.3]
MFLAFHQLFSIISRGLPLSVPVCHFPTRLTVQVETGTTCH